MADAIGGTKHWDVRIRGQAPDALMDVAKAREWLFAGQEIGAHTLTPRLTAIPETQTKEEVSPSKKNLGDLFGVTVRHFCYPYGKWSRRVRDLVSLAQFSQPRCAGPRGISALVFLAALEEALPQE